MASPVKPQTKLASDPTDIRLVALDLDGTLLDNDKRIDPETEAALKALSARGIHVVIASARPPRGVRAIYQQLGLSNWQINYNGALIWDEPANKPIFHRPMPGALTARMIEICRDQFEEIGVHCEIMDRWYTDRPVTSFVTETGRLFQPDGIVPVEKICNDAVTKLMLTGEPPMLMKIESLLLEEFGNDVTIVSTDAHLMQIMDRRVGKAKALKKMAAHLGITPRQIMAVGDAPNDVGMLQLAGVAVAMENAMDVVKKVAHYIAPANDKQGVLGALKKYGLYSG